FVLRIDGLSSCGNRLIGGVEKDDGYQFARFNEFVSASIDQFAEGTFQAILRNHASEANTSKKCAKRVRDVLGATTQVGFGGFADADVFLDLPTDDQQPDAEDEPVNQEIAPGQFHRITL